MIAAREKEELVSSDDYVQTVFTQVIADHLALREQNAALEERMPLRDYLPFNYVQSGSSQPFDLRPPGRQWFEQEDGSELGWAA